MANRTPLIRLNGRTVGLPSADRLAHTLLSDASGGGVLLYDASGVPTQYTGGSTGQVLTKQSDGSWAAATPSGGGIGVKASKTSSQEFTSTSLADVTSLSVSVEANTLYRLAMILSIVGSASSTGIKLGWTYPTGATMLWHGMSDLNTGGGLFSFNSDPNFATYASGLSESATFTGTNDTTTRPLLIGGLVHVGGNAGTLQLQAARYAGSGTATINKGTLTIF